MTPEAWIMLYLDASGLLAFWLYQRYGVDEIKAMLNRLTRGFARR